MATQEAVHVAYPVALDCPACRRPHRRLVITNELVTDVFGDLIGIEGVVRFEDCGNRVPDAFADPAAVAWWLEMCGDEG